VWPDWSEDPIPVREFFSKRSKGAMQLLHRGTAYNLQGGNQTHRPHFGMTAAFLDARHKPVIPLPAKSGGQVSHSYQYQKPAVSRVRGRPGTV